MRFLADPSKDEGLGWEDGTGCDIWRHRLHYDQHQLEELWRRVQAR